MTLAASARQATARRLAILVWATSVGLCLIAVAILIATAWVPVPVSWGFRGSSDLVAITSGTVGVVVAVRRPTHAIGWLFIAIGACFSVESLANEYVIAGALAVPGQLPAVTAVAWVLTWIWIPSIAMALIFLPLLFPTGRLPSRRWRPAAWFGALATMAFCLAISVAPGPIQQATFIDNPLGSSGLNADLFAVITLTFVLAIFVAVVSLVRRFHGSDQETRRQIKWFALASAIALVVDGLYFLGFVANADPTVLKAAEIILIVAILGLPVAAGLAVLRYRLYDIDRIISRTISYGAVTALLVAAYGFVVLLLQDPLGAITGGDTVPVAVSTLVVAGLFNPVRGRVQVIVDRRFDRARFDTERTTAAFADRLRDQVDLPTLTADLDTTVRAAIAPTRVDLWLRGTAR